MSRRRASTDTAPRALGSGGPRAARRLGASLTLLLGLGLLVASRSAHAQEDPKVLAARALFDEGRRLMKAGELQAACTKFEESQGLNSGIGTQFNLASCYEKTGRVASAWSLYRRVAAETRSLGQAEREGVARARADALAPRLSRLTLQVQTPVEGLSVRLDDTEMGPATWGVATPIDPGEHRLVASAPGHQAWQGKATIPEVAEQVIVEVPRLVAAAPEVAPPPPTTPPTEPADPAIDDESGWSTPWTIGVVGASSVALAGLFGLSFLSKNGDAKNICAETGRQSACPQPEIDRHDELLKDARGARGAGLAFLGLGVAALGVSAVWILSEGDESDSASLEVHTRAAPDSLSVGLSGRF